MTTPRATSSQAEELGATIAGLKSRLNQIESAFGFGDAPVGSIVLYISNTPPSNWSLCNGGTITNGRLLYPELWAVLPSGFKSGDNIVKPNIASSGTPAIYRIIRLI